MIAALALGGFLLAAEPAKPAPQLWVWSLYENKASVTLAHEVPDTSVLGAVLECAPGSGRIKVTVYPDNARPQDRLTAQIASADKPFQTFLGTGHLLLKSDAASAEVVLPPADKPKLDRFAKLCG